IAHHVACDIVQIFVFAKRVVVETGLPNSSSSSACTIDLECATALYESDHLGEVASRMKLEQPVQVVRHYYIGESTGAGAGRRRVQRPHDDAAKAEIRKQPLPVVRHSRHEVDLPADRRS